MKLVLIEAPTIAAAWSQLVTKIYNDGEYHMPDYGVYTQRVHATIHVENVEKHQVNAFVPFGVRLVDDYKAQLLKEYAEWYDSLDKDDPRRFVYCYADQLFNFGEKHMNVIHDVVRNARLGSRRHVGTIWDNTKFVNQFEDMPCWIAYKVEILYDDYAVLYILYRSWDAFGGMPANLPAIINAFNTEAKLQEKTWRIKELVATGWDTHITSSDFSAVEKIIKKTRICPRCGEFVLKYDAQPTTKGYLCSVCSSSEPRI